LSHSSTKVVSTLTTCRMMILQLIFFFVVFANAHELVAPCDDDDMSELHKDELSSMHMFKMFVDSGGNLLQLPDLAIIASDDYNQDHGAKYSRIGAAQVDGKAHGWCSKEKKHSSHIMVDLTTSSMVTGVATQGRGDNPHWVKRYSIETSENGQEWIDHGNFAGNFDSDTICQSRLEHPVLARFVKLTVVEFESHPCMKWDVLTYNKL